MNHPFNTVPFTENFPQPVDVSGFQRDIDKLFGFEPKTGRSWIRLVWMPSNRLDDIGWPETHDWNEYGDGGRGMWRRRYLYSATQTFIDRMDPETGLWYSHEIWDDVAPPRFALESLTPPEIALDGWVHQGYDQDGDKFTSRKPTHGFYRPLAIQGTVSALLIGGMFARHENGCCARANADAVQCYGSYVEPGTEHMQELRRLWHLKHNVDKERRIGYATADEMDAARRRTTEKNTKYWEQFGERLKQITAEALRTHKATLSDDPSVQKNGIYHFMGDHTKSGRKNANGSSKDKQIIPAI